MPEIKVNLYDIHGGQTSKTVAHSGTQAAAITYGATFKANFTAISDAGIFRTVTIDTNKDATTNVSAPGPSSNVDEGCTLSVMMDNGELGVLKIPCPKKDANGEFVYILNGAVDITNVDIINYVKMYGKTGSFGLATDGPLFIAGSRKVTAIISGSLDPK